MLFDWIYPAYTPVLQRAIEIWYQDPQVTTPVLKLFAGECKLWQYGLWSFQTGYTKLESFLHKTQHTQRKLLNFESWTNGEPQ